MAILWNTGTILFDNFQFVVLKIQLNNPSKNRCYMEANKPCNSGTTPQLAGIGQHTGRIIGVGPIRKIGRENRISKSAFFISKAGKIVRSQLAGIQRKLYIIVPTDRQDRLKETITKNRCKPSKNGLQRQFWHPWRESNSQLTLRSMAYHVIHGSDVTSNIIPYAE